jgi:sigma-54 dependent transcriptional regulator, acetoin dehydrogenase operon transcriptional activator AcoR
VGDTVGTTLSIHADAKGVRAGSRVEPVLVLALECGRPRMGAVRYRLGDLTSVHIGRGSERRADRSGTELTIKIPDKWMSSKHARIEPSLGRWVLVDTESKNGSTVDGHATKRAVLTDGSLIELGHALFLFFEKLPIDADTPAVFEVAPGDAMTSLVPSWESELVRLRQLATSEIPILLEGDPGSGKHSLASSLHMLSKRTGPFVAVNAASLADDFGKSIEAGGGGTVLVDHIDELPATEQMTLVRALQDKELVAATGARPTPIDVRVIAAASRDLEDRVADGSFRQDLFARLAGVRIAVPSVSERRGDLGLLIAALHARIFAPEHPGFDIDAARALLRYPWPLNVREIEQALATAKVLAGNDPVRAEHLPDSVRSGRPPGAPRPAVLSELDQRVRDQVIAALREHQGNVSAVARALDKDRKQIQRWIKRFGLDPATYR